MEGVLLRVFQQFRNHERQIHPADYNGYNQINRSVELFFMMRLYLRVVKRVDRVSKKYCCDRDSHRNGWDCWRIIRWIWEDDLSAESTKTWTK
jgi:hypothetical protein